MVLELAFGLAILAVGIGGAVAGWLHPDPSSLRMVQLMAWPRQRPDRADIRLLGIFHAALGAVFLLGSFGGHLAALLACGAVMLGTGVALGVRHRTG